MAFRIAWPRTGQRARPCLRRSLGTCRHRSRCLHGVVYRRAQTWRDQGRSCI